jgi:hypothetical protein
VNGIGGNLGVIVMAAVLAAYCAGIYVLSRRAAVDATNVNDAWDESGGGPPAPQPVAAGASR